MGDIADMMMQQAFDEWCELDYSGQHGDRWDLFRRYEPLRFTCKFCNSSEMLTWTQDRDTGKWFPAELSGHQHICRAADEFEVLD